VSFLFSFLPAILQLLVLQSTGLLRAQTEATMFFPVHPCFSGLNLLEAEHATAISAKLASALSSLRQVITIQNVVILPS
jgi:hypothetical protein